MSNWIIWRTTPLTDYWRPTNYETGCVCSLCSPGCGVGPGPVAGRVKNACVYLAKCISFFKAADVVADVATVMMMTMMLMMILKREGLATTIHSNCTTGIECTPSEWIPSSSTSRDSLTHSLHFIPFLLLTFAVCVPAFLLCLPVYRQIWRRAREKLLRVEMVTLTRGV